MNELDNLEVGGAVIQGNFPQHRGRPDWVTKALQRHAGLSYRKDSNGNCWLEGSDVELPNGQRVDTNLGYLRTTGQWREDLAHGYDVEVFCCKTHKSGWIPVRLLIGVRLVDNL